MAYTFSGKILSILNILIYSDSEKKNDVKFCIVYFQL